MESFNGKFRDECLNQHWFTSLHDARSQIEPWRLDYNEVRPHSSLGGLPPAVQARGQIPLIGSPSGLDQALADLDPDEMTPIQALTRLYELRARARRES